MEGEGLRLREGRLEVGVARKNERGGRRAMAKRAGAVVRSLSLRARARQSKSSPSSPRIAPSSYVDPSSRKHRTP